LYYKFITKFNIIGALIEIVKDSTLNIIPISLYTLFRKITEQINTYFISTKSLLFLRFLYL